MKLLTAFVYEYIVFFSAKKVNTKNSTIMTSSSIANLKAIDAQSSSELESIQH